MGAECGEASSEAAVIVQDAAGAECSGDRREGRQEPCVQGFPTWWQ